MSVPSQRTAPEGRIDNEGNLVIGGEKYSPGPLMKRYNMSYSNGKLVVIPPTGVPATYTLEEQGPKGYTFRIDHTPLGYVGPETITFTRVEEPAINPNAVVERRSRSNKGVKKVSVKSKNLVGYEPPQQTKAVGPDLRVEDISIDTVPIKQLKNPSQGGGVSLERKIGHHVRMERGPKSAPLPQNVKIDVGEVKRGDEKKPSEGGITLERNLTDLTANPTPTEKPEVPISAEEGADIPQGRVEVSSESESSGSVKLERPQLYKVGQIGNHYVYCYCFKDELTEEKVMEIAKEHVDKAPPGYPIIVTTSGVPDLGGRQPAYVIEVNEFGMTSAYSARV